MASSFPCWNPLDQPGVSAGDDVYPSSVAPPAGTDSGLNPELASAGFDAEPTGTGAEPAGTDAAPAGIGVVPDTGSSEPSGVSTPAMSSTLEQFAQHKATPTTKDGIKFFTSRG